jgi:hypothetical protein
MGERDELAAVRFPSLLGLGKSGRQGYPRGGIQRIVRKRMNTLGLRAFLHARTESYWILLIWVSPPPVFSERMTNKGLRLDAARKSGKCET